MMPHRRPQGQVASREIIIIGYPANRALQRLYRDLGAIGDDPAAGG